MFGWFKRSEPEIEKRATASGFTAEIMSARESYISGRQGIADLTATAQTCISLWEGALSLADVQGTTLLTRHSMAMAAHGLALRGEAVFLLRAEGLIPASDWDLRTRDGVPTAYRLSISEAGGGRTMTALAGEVLHFRIGSDPVTPWAGQAPLRRSRLTAGLLQSVETALSEAFENMPLGSQVVPMPEQPEVDNAALGRSFRGQRGRVLLRESVSVSAAGGPAPAADWRPASLTPDIQGAMPAQMLQTARDGVLQAFGVLPGLMNSMTTGPMVREAQRHLAGWTLQPIAMLMAEEASQKLGNGIMIDVMRPVQAFDAGGRSRALATIVEALARAKEVGIDGAELNNALSLINWGEGDQAA